MKKAVVFLAVAALVVTVTACSSGRGYRQSPATTYSAPSTYAAPPSSMPAPSSAAPAGAGQAGGCGGCGGGKACS